MKKTYQAPAAQLYNFRLEGFLASSKADQINTFEEELDASESYAGHKESIWDE